MHFEFGNMKEAPKVDADLASTLPVMHGNRRHSYDVGKKVASFLPCDKQDLKKSPSDAAVCSIRFTNRRSTEWETASIKAVRKSKNGKWKDCYLVLKDGSGSRLYVYKNKNRVISKIALDLSSCVLYKIDESVAHHSNCVFISSTAHDSCDSACLSFLSYCDFAQWFGYLKMRCFGCPRLVFSSSAVPSISFRATSLIRLDIESYRGKKLNMKSMYSVSASVNGVQIIETMPVPPTAEDYICFDMSSFIEKIPSGPCNLQLQLVPHISPFGKQHSPKSPRQENSSVFPLINDGSKLSVSQKQGFSFSAVQYNVAVLPEQSYSPLLGLLKSDSFSFCLRTGNVLDGLNRRYFARNLLTVFLPSPSLFLSFIDALLDAEVRCGTASTLFRHDSFCTTCISTALNILGRDLVLDEVSRLLQQIDLESASTPLETFLVTLRSLVPRLPRLFNSVMARVSQAVLNLFPDDPWYAKQTVSSFFILRFMGPILTFWNVSGGPVRKLAQTLQGVANQSSSPYFDPETATEPEAMVSQILDEFVPSTKDLKEGNGGSVQYNRGEYFALLAFQMLEVLSEEKRLYYFRRKPVVSTLRSLLGLPTAMSFD